MQKAQDTTTANLDVIDPTPTNPLALSVVLPNYNHGKLISRAVTALLAQERAPDEIVIVDDGSTDDSLRVIEAHAAGSKTIRVIANRTNEGATAALARGLDACRGTYVYFAAADDWVLPGFFATVLPVLERHPQAGLVWRRAHRGGRPSRRADRRAAGRPAEQPDQLFLACRDGGAAQARRQLDTDREPEPGAQPRRP